MVETKEINPKTAEYLIIDNPKTSNFYLLPKIHKNIIPPPGYQPKAALLNESLNLWTTSYNH